MIRENEIILLILGVGVLVLIVANYTRLKRYPSTNTLIAGFCFNLLGWSLTNLEGFIWEETLNFAEHLCYFAGALCLAAWVWSAKALDEEMD